MFKEINDLTFVIPIRIDSVIRLENLCAVIRYIRKLHCSIIVLESSKVNNGFVKRVLPSCSLIKHVFVKDCDIIFHRTLFINMALEYVKTRFVAIWDADVIVDNKQIIESIDSLRKGFCDVSFPYNGICLNTDNTLRDIYIEKNNINILHKYHHYMNNLYNKNYENFVGGGFIINKDKYIEAGKENERFYGWGPEDLERVLRWENMGYTIHRSHGVMYHLCHPRDVNGFSRSAVHDNICKLQLLNSEYGSKKEILNNE